MSVYDNLKSSTLDTATKICKERVDNEMANFIDAKDLAKKRFGSDLNPEYQDIYRSITDSGNNLKILRNKVLEQSKTLGVKSDEDFKAILKLVKEQFINKRK